MRLRIKQEFVDKHTEECYKAGTEHDFADGRAKELLADPRGLVEAVPTAPAPKKATSASATKKKAGVKKTS